MNIRLSAHERDQVRAFRRLMHRVRQRNSKPARERKTYGRQLCREHKAAIAGLFCVATAVRFGIERYGVHVAHLRFSASAYGV